MNHTIQGLSNDMEGGMKDYLGASCDYGSGFMETIMGFQPGAFNACGKM